MKQSKKETNGFSGEACETSNGRNFEKTSAASALEKLMQEKNESAFCEIRAAARRLTNSQSFINVTEADGVYVVQPIVASPVYDAATAAGNTARMKDIMLNAGADCVIYFPAGAYYFDGAAPGWTGTITSTANRQTFMGDGMNGTLIRQKSTSVASTIHILHERCMITDMHICSADSQDSFHASWEAQQHQTAIHLDALEAWSTEPQILNVAINSVGNNIVVKKYFRSFTTGIKVTGQWVNTYVHTVWMNYVQYGVDIYQQTMAGPIYFIDVHLYAPTDYGIADNDSAENGIEDNGQKLGPRPWNIFFRILGRVMEDIEILHCTYIGSQFLYIDLQTEDEPGRLPVLSLVVDHCYINTLWRDDQDDETKSGIYMNLPGSGVADTSRDIRFTNNNCTGRSPGNGAFFYLMGTIHGIIFQSNYMCCGGADKGVYIRATEHYKADDDFSVRDVLISDNDFVNYRTPITIGGDLHDPSRPGVHEDTYFNERVTISNNRSQYDPGNEEIGLSAVFANRCRKLIIQGNNFAPTAGFPIAARLCEDVTITANHVCGLHTTSDRSGIFLESCKGVAVSANTVGNVASGVYVLATTNSTIVGNVIHHTAAALKIENVTNCVVVGNLDTNGSSVLGKNENLKIRSNLVLADH